MSPRRRARDRPPSSSSTKLGGLRDELLHELHGLCSLDFDGRDYLTLWLVGHSLSRRLPPAAHRARPARPRPPPTRRQDRPIVLETCSITASPTPPHPLCSPTTPAPRFLHAARGLPGSSATSSASPSSSPTSAPPQIDASIINSALILLHLDHPKLNPKPLPKSRFQRDPRSRA
ncbi:MAG: hypothetical protein IPK80_21230 [Nannocystis sp.]|nr:hypothetical protein [Nannocystis sp.]